MPIWTPSRPHSTCASMICWKSHPERPPTRPRVGIGPPMSDTEVITLAVLAALLGHTSESHWLRFDRARLRRLFPYLPQQPGYNKRLRKLTATFA
jgi:hypothetical protein